MVEKIDDAVLKFNKTPINTYILISEREKKHQINVFYKPATDNIIHIFNALKSKEKKTIYCSF